MAELAIFGGVLLTVLAFFLRYAMNLNNNLQLKMQVYKTALTKAKADMDLNQTYVYRDYSAADPQDQFGFTPRQVNSAADYVSWTDTKEKKALPPGINYTFISKSPPEERIAFSETFTTAKNVGYNVSSIQMEYPFWEEPVTITKLKAYTEEDPDGQLKLLVDDLAKGDCTEAYCPTDIVASGDIDHDGNFEDVLSAKGEGTVVGEMRDYQRGQIDQGKMDPWEDPSGYQGVHLPQVSVNRGDTMFVGDSGGSLVSTNTLGETTRNDYKIQLNEGGSRAVSLETTENSVWVIYGSK